MPVAYQTNVDLPSFAGIDQSNDGYNMSMRLARFAYNCDFSDGALAPFKLGKSIGVKTQQPIGTLAHLHRRYHVREDEHDILVAISDGVVYTKLLDHDDEWVKRYDGLKNSDCDYVTYEINPQGSDAPVDVLLFTNADDGMFMLRGDTLKVNKVRTPKKFGCIARYYDRIWGSGIKDEPDMLVYSAPYDPTDWQANPEIPEDGAGDILQPSWDGDEFVALKSFGSYLLAFKRNAIWKIYGTNPADFVMKQQYGSGSIVQNSICVSTTHVLMLGWDGIMRYDGTSVEPFQQAMVQEIMSKMNKSARDKCCAIMDGKKFMLAMPINGSIVNNSLLIYNITDRCWSFVNDIFIESFLAFDDRVFFTTSNDDGDVHEFGLGDVMPLGWVSGYQDLGIKTSVKSAFTLYFMIESEKAYVPITFRIRTEKKVKEKTLMVQTGKSKSININNSGRFFRLEIVSNSHHDWRLVGGVQMHCELDPDF